MGSRSDDELLRDESGRHLTIDLHKIAAKHLCHDIAELAQVLMLDDADEDDENWGTVRNLYRKARKGLVIGRTRESEIKEMSDKDVRRYLGKCYYLLFHKVLFRLYNDAFSNKKGKEEHAEPDEVEESFRSANSSMTEEMTSLKDELLKCQREVNQLQKQIIDMQSEELKSVRSVTETVQKDLNSWSAVVAQNCAAATAPRKIGAALRTPQPPKKIAELRTLLFMACQRRRTRQLLIVYIVFLRSSTRSLPYHHLLDLEPLLTGKPGPSGLPWSLETVF